ncbi:insulinase family protein [Roseiflexus castenholzii]|jgi:Zn-dependent M16 (insulinase) family peptidase|uniref:Peptidase M16C associated domain protein n=1 Tax=Roseiflexus castenholzii (strain DSM 13941 / HLO8) TaxID=383372 RepID=A7NH70_ROSCS|nr:insulinase family protein [Roseiflexus castenholzii]ABU56817.1 Peptidase M16C associated domain protein [Roseiflexus castenholzii DSM 13941]
MNVIHGFELLREQQIAELNSLARWYRHVATGAELLSLINDDENKVFGITFRTPPPDSTGVAHILEHSVLCGSEKYPLKKPFVELLKGSLKTFLNAMTYSDKTVYPVASTNTKDFYNLVDVYLDAVFHPRISPEVLQQEGWRYEVNEDGSLGYRGVVFNEMKGANVSPDRVLYLAVQRSLFPGHVYSVDSGGDPAEIPNLTYEQFKAFHERYYHPSNALIFFYGDDDPEERLRLLDRVLAPFERIPVDSMIPLQPPLSEPQHVEAPYPAGPNSIDKHMVAVNWLLPNPPDIEEALALDILEHALVGTPAAPLRKALIDSGLGENLTGSGFARLRQTYFTVGLKGVKGENIGATEDVIIGTLERLARDGIDSQTIEAAVNTVEFQLRENNTGSYPRGLAVLIRALDTWLYGDDPLAPLMFEAPLRAIKQRLSAGERVFEHMIEEKLLRNPHRTTVVLVPDLELTNRQNAAERERLVAIRATLDEAQIAAINATAARLKQIQETPDPPEALASLPSLTIADLDRTIKTIPTEELAIGATRVLLHNLFTNGIVYVDIGMNLRVLPQEFLPYVTIFGRALLETGTQHEDVVQLIQRIGRDTGGIFPQSFTSAMRGRSIGAAWLFLRGKAIVEKSDALLDILHDVVLSARLDNRERIRQIVREERASREASLIPAGHTVVSTRLRARFSEADWVAEQIGGVSYLMFLRRIERTIDEEWETVRAVLEHMRARLIDRSALLVNVTVDAAGWERFRPHLEAFLDRLPVGTTIPAAWNPHKGAPSEGLIIPAHVNYVAKGADLYRLGYRLHGSALVVTRYLMTTWLWEQIREQGGAYGGFCSFDPRSGVFSYTSYRDPNLLRTIDVYDRSAAFLRQLDLSEKELTRAIIGVIADLDAYQLPDARGFTAMARFLVGDDDAYRQQVREEVLGTTPADFRAFADVLDIVRDNAALVVMGGEDAITAANQERSLFAEITRVL